MVAATIDGLADGAALVDGNVKFRVFFSEDLPNNRFSTCAFWQFDDSGTGTGEYSTEGCVRIDAETTDTFITCVRPRSYLAISSILDRSVTT